MDKRGRTKVFIGIFAILLVSLSLILFVSPDSGNTRVYDSQTKTAMIKDASNVDIASVTLNTPQDYLVGAGYQKVAEFTINPNQDYSNILGSFEFYNLRDGNKAIQKQIDVKYLTTEQVSVDDFTTECSNIFDEENQTTYEVCNQVVSGSHLEERNVWIDFDNSIRTNEEVVIGLFTNVGVGDKIEWVPTIAGVKISEWAVWTQSLNVDLVDYHDYEGTGEGTLIDRVVGYSDYNGTIVGTAYNISSLVGSALNFTSGSYVNMYKNITNGSSQGTICFLAEISSSSTNYGWLWGGYQDGSNVYMGLGKTGVDNSTYTIESIGTLIANTSITLDSWNLICGDWGSTGMHFWLNNGTLAEYNAGIGKPSTYGGYWIAGRNSDNIHYPWLAISEDAAWTRQLSQSEIQQVYTNWMSGVGYANIFDAISPETTPPIIMPSIPNSSVNLYCNATLTDDLQPNLTAIWTWYKNNIGYSSGDTSVQNGTNSLITTLGVGNTTKGEQWICEVTPYDGFNYGNASNSTAVTILNSVPTQNNPLLSTPSGKNLSTENLTCYNQSTFDADSDAVVNIYNWYKDSQPLTVLNLPFEGNANDYSGNNNSGIIYGNSQFMTGKFGRTLHFNGINQSINISDSNSLDITNQISIETWINLDSLNKTMILDKNLAYRLWLPNATTSTFVFAIYIGGSWTNVTSNTALNIGTWYHLVATYNGSSAKLYINGAEDKNQAVSGLIGTSSQKVIIGTYAGDYYLNGTIDELRIYNYTLTPEQISADSNLEYNKIVSQETSGGDNYMCQVTPNDGEIDGATLNSSSLNVMWGITFNVTDSFSNASLDNVLINCNQTGFNQLGDTTNTYGPYGFSPGTYSGEFARDNYYNKTITFTADVDKTVNALVSARAQITAEEHTWLEGIYNCVVLGDCSLYNLMVEINQTTLQINQTVNNIWQNTKPTDQSVIINETITNKVVNSTKNLTIDYSVNIPIKAGYTLGTYLPVRIGFWFLNISNNVTCFNQGDRPTGVTSPYCQPLITEVVGPMGGQVNFTVNLRPNVTLANYTIKRIVDIDPNNVWINYGQEAIGIMEVKENSDSYGISALKTGENNPSVNNQQVSATPPSTGGNIGESSITNIYNTYVTNGNNTPAGANSDNGNNKESSSAVITGGVIGSLLSSGSIIILTGLLAGLFILFIISKTIIKLKKR